MPETTSRSTRNLSASRSQVSQTLGGSRPFLNMLNPMGKAYQGYSQANQSLLEEEDENGSSAEAEDLEAGGSQSTIFQSTLHGKPLTKSKSQGRRRVSWDAGASEMNVLRPNIHQEDKIHERDSSDDEVPQSFMIEAASRKPAFSKGKTKVRDPSGRNQPLHSVAGRKLPPALPTVSGEPLPPVSIPPRPSEVDADEQTPQNTSFSGARFSDHSADQDRQHKPMRGLDAYERALWNWVNVYNLDAFLQEVYYYYEGKGIYSIALARGLNLLLVTSLPLAPFWWGTATNRRTLNI